MEQSAEFTHELEQILHDHPMSQTEPPGPELLQAYVAFARKWPREVSSCYAEITYALAGKPLTGKLVVCNPLRPALLNAIWRRGCAHFADPVQLADTLVSAIQQDEKKQLAEAAAIAGIMFSSEEDSPLSAAEARTMANVVAFQAHKFTQRAAP